MPDSNYPPFANDAGALIIPRQLLRWIDVNPQGGHLRRAQLYITLPPFGPITPNWVGVSDITAAINFEAPNNFTLPVGGNPSATVQQLLITVQVGQTVADNRVGIGAEGNNNTLLGGS